MKKFGPGSDIWNNGASLLNELGALVGNVLDSLDGLAKWLGGQGLAKYGGSEGGMLLGRIFNLVDEATATGLKGKAGTIADIGQSLADEGIELSDEAAEGLGKLARSLPGDRAKRVLDRLCPAVVQVNNYRGPGLASPLYQVCDLDLFDKVLTTIKQWDDTALEGFERVAKAGIDDDTLAKFMTKFAKDTPNGQAISNKILNFAGTRSDDIIARKTFHVLKEISIEWSDDAMEGVEVLIKRAGRDENKVWLILRHESGVGGAELGERLFKLVKQAEEADLDNWPGFASKMAGIGDGSIGNLWGGSHVLFFIEESGGFSKFDSFEEFVSEGNLKRFYDLVGSDGSLYELKNIKNMKHSDYKQLATDLQLLSDNELKNLKWVFRGAEDKLPFSKKSIVDGLINHISGRGDLSDAVKQDLLKKIQKGFFGKNNIQFTGGSRPYP